MRTAVFIAAAALVCGSHFVVNYSKYSNTSDMLKFPTRSLWFLVQQVATHIAIFCFWVGIYWFWALPGPTHVADTWIMVRLSLGTGGWCLFWTFVLKPWLYFQVPPKDKKTRAA